jgi:cyclopropane fatty-acyl-phospholipid synthase-like methyltransferase
MQNERTWQFWDDYYTSQEKDAQEWIVEPTIDLLEKLSEHLPRHNRTIHILEIGCGISTLARDFWSYLLKKNIDANVIATDISPVCIALNQQRDDLTSTEHRFEYRTLNVAEQHPDLNESFDIILDKGCLDTFAFRSKQRGQNQPYALLIRTVLDNIHSWLQPDGVYWVLTPRRKFRSVRDFRGFETVHRVELTTIPRGELVSTQQHTYLHVCQKNQQYLPNTDDHAFCKGHEETIDDDSFCPKCHKTFYEFRKGEPMDGRGKSVWWRRWSGHCRHCERK